MGTWGHGVEGTCGGDTWGHGVQGKRHAALRGVLEVATQTFREADEMIFK